MSSSQTSLVTESNETRSTETARVTITLISARKPPVLSKSFYLKEDGSFEKRSGGSLVSGIAQMLRPSIHQFCEALKSLKPDQALIYGTANHETALIVPQRKLRGAATSKSKLPIIARDREHFSWPQTPASLMIDYDPEHGVPPLKRDELLQALYSVWPELKVHPHIWAASASSCIHRSDTGEELRGIMGQRLYVPVKDACDIPRAGFNLFQRLWLSGFGRYDISKSGALLERSIIDQAVWQPERLDFAGGAHCGPGLEQRRPEPIAFNADAPFIDTRATLPELPDGDKLEIQELQLAAQRAKRPERKQRQAEWIAERIEQVLENLPADQRNTARVHAEEKFRRAVDEKRLLADFILHSQKHGPVSVGQILDNPDKFDGERFADPLEPDYCGDRRIAVVNLRCAGSPYLYSHAHGGQRFTLHRTLQTIRIKGGELPQIASLVLELLKITGEVFDRGGEMVRIAGGRIYPVSPEWLALHITGLSRLEKLDRRSGEWHAIDCPPALAKTICSMTGIWNLPRLTGIISAPSITPEGRVIDADGFDTETKLYLDFPDSAKWPGINPSPSIDLVKDAVENLWKPFRQFPFVDAASRGVHLAALLTAAVRSLLPTAPGTGYTAPAAGSGKTLLALCVAALGGQEPVVMPPTEDDTELRKRLLAVAREGARTVIIDNISGTFKSDALCAFLTSQHYSDRVLGATITLSIPTNFNVLVTGNGLTVVGDLNRRLLRCEIDPRCEQPFLRKFKFDPLTFVRDNRLELVHAALTILRAFTQDREHPREPLASFDAWSALVRSAVNWIGTKAFLDVADPVDTLVEACALDPESQKLCRLLHAWRETFGPSGGRVADAIKKADIERNGRLYQSLDEVAGEHGRINSRRLGRWIEVRARRIVDGLYFTKAGSRSDRAVWVVSDTAEERNGRSERKGHIRRVEMSPEISEMTNLYDDTDNSVKTIQTVEAAICDACVNFAPNSVNPRSEPGICIRPSDEKQTRLPTDGAGCPAFERVMH